MSRQQEKNAKHDYGQVTDAWFAYPGMEYTKVDEITVDSILDDDRLHWTFVREQAGYEYTEVVENVVRGNYGDHPYMTEQVEITRFQPVHKDKYLRRSDHPELAFKVGTGYNPIDLSYRDQYLPVVQRLVDEFEVIPRAWITWKAGARFLVSFQLPGEIVFGDDDDRGCQFLNLVGSRDGSSTEFGLGTAGRFNCANEFDAALLKASLGRLFSIRHSGSADDLWDMAVETMYSTLAQAGDIERAVEQLIDATYTTADFNELVGQLIGERPAEDAGRALTNYDNRRAEIYGQYYAGNLDAVRETRFGALQAIQAWRQHSFGSDSGRSERNIRSLVANDDRVLNQAAELLAV